MQGIFTEANEELYGVLDGDVRLGPSRLICSTRWIFTFRMAATGRNWVHDVVTRSAWQ